LISPLTFALTSSAPVHARSYNKNSLTHLQSVG
jgi:hypothetical protein